MIPLSFHLMSLTPRWAMALSGRIGRSWIVVVLSFSVQALAWPSIGSSDDRTLRPRLIQQTYQALTGSAPRETSAQAWVETDDPMWREEMVDSLIASPEFGEHLANRWLESFDIPQVDPRGWVGRASAIYKRWCRDAIQSDMRMDDFIRWQLAGDLVNGPDDGPLIATAFQRIIPVDIDENFDPESIGRDIVSRRLDRVERLLLGGSSRSRQVHEDLAIAPTFASDPQLRAMFLNRTESILGPERQEVPPEPTVLFPDKKALARFRQAADWTRAEFERGLKRLEDSGAVGNWYASLTTWPIPSQSLMISECSIDEVDRESIHVVRKDSHSKADKGPARIVREGLRTIFELDRQSALTVPISFSFDRLKEFSLHFELWVPESVNSGMLLYSSTYDSAPYPAGFELRVEEGRLQAALVDQWPERALSVRTKDPLRTGRWLSIVVINQSLGQPDDLQIVIQGERQACDSIAFGPPMDFQLRALPMTVSLGARWETPGVAGAKLDDLSLYSKGLTVVEAIGISGDQPWSTWEELSPATQRDWTVHALRRNSGGEYLFESIHHYIDSANGVLSSAPALPIMRDRRELSGGHEHSGGVCLGIATKSVPQDRMAFASWIFSEQERVVARATVMLLWKQMTGVELAPSDIPADLALVESLSRVLMESGWSRKQLVRSIVLSDAFVR